MARIEDSMSANILSVAMQPNGLEELTTIGIMEVLDEDSRPTFVCDLDPDLTIPMATTCLSPIFSNAALRTFEPLADVIFGHSPVETLRIQTETPYASFRSWVLSVTTFDDSKDIYPSSYLYSGLLWTGSTVRKRWRIISGNQLYQAATVAAGDLSMGPPSEISGMSGQNTLSDVNMESTQPSSKKPHTSRSSEKKDSTSSSVVRESQASIILGATPKSAVDWTCAVPQGYLTPHIEFARTIDWATTSLGPMSSWSPEFRQIANLLMKSPHAGAVFFGNELTVMYNQSYMEIVAGNKHPSLMGTGFKGPFRELWDSVSPLFNACAATGESVAMVDQMLPIERRGFLEESYFSWSITPIYGAGNKVLGFYNAPFETTRQVINTRRMHTLRRLGDEISHAMTVTGFWKAVLRGLEDSPLDIPFALLYSLTDLDDPEDASASSGSSLALKSCVFEGGLGIPEGHIAAPARMDLKRSREGFIPSFREAMRTREPTKLQMRDGTLPEFLTEGIEWRGYGDPCREAIIFPLRPTTGDNVLGFLLIGISPRRPYDEDYVSFVNMLNRQLATSLASIILFEDEIRRGQTAAEAAAIERERLSDELAMQTNRLKQMAETSPVGMMLFDPQGAILEANDRWFDMTGHSRDEIHEKSWLGVLQESSLNAMIAGWHTVTVEGIPWSDELLLKRPWVDHITGETLEYWILAAYHPEIGPDGTVRSILSSMTDISRIKWAEGLQNQRLEEAEETRRRQNAFIDLTSHEMRNPLSAILHSADEISSALGDYQKWQHQDGTMPPEVKNCMEAAETITLCAQHQKMIVDDILTVSKLDSVLLTITPEAVQPAVVTQQALKMFDAELQKKDIKMEFLTQQSYQTLQVDWVLLDQSRLLQVLINLITNAIKFTQSEAERAISVYVGAYMTPPVADDPDFQYIPTMATKHSLVEGDDWGKGEELYLKFTVRDTGCGLTESEKKLLFLRFSQASPRTHAQYGGSGLGLFISRQLTELHGGQIGVGSEAGVGSTFAFYIKVRRTGTPSRRVSAMSTLSSETQTRNASALERRPSTIPQTKPAIDPHLLNILIVEDNLVNQKVLSKQLLKLGCTVHVANHGGEALTFLESTTIWATNQGRGENLSVILMDLEMPIMDGLTCVREIRRLQASGTLVAHVPVVAVTANVRIEQIDTAKQAGMDSVVSKPFRIPELMARLEELLNQA